MFLPEPLLKGMQLAVLRHTFDGLDRATISLDCEYGTAFNGPSVHKDRTGSTAGSITADVRTGQTQFLTKEVHQQHAGFDFTTVGLAVHGHGDHMLAHFIPPEALSIA
jgi:hypothetical protein